MARTLDKQKAIKLRLKGKSYSEIKSVLGISKGTLSGWLANYPLSSEKIKELRDNNPRRIEHFRETMRKKREGRVDLVYQKVQKDFKKITEREKYIAGFFLYWAEGGKTGKSSVALTNTNPAMLKFFIEWLQMFDVPKDKMKVHLHLYSDMDIPEAVNYWSQQLGFSKKQFRKPYIKKTLSADITYRNGFGKGTCSIIVGSRDLSEYVLMGLKYFNEAYGGLSK